MVPHFPAGPFSAMVHKYQTPDTIYALTIAAALGTFPLLMLVFLPTWVDLSIYLSVWP